MADQEKIEEAAINQYMAAGVTITDQEKISYFQSRLKNILDGYRFLRLQKEEYDRYTEKGHREDLLSKLTRLFRENYSERVAVVTELRRLGVKVDDQFVPLSKA